MKQQKTLLALGAAAWLVAAAWPRPTVYAGQAAAPSPVTAADAQGIYEEKCALCHGATRAGNPPVFPTLIGVTAKYSDAEIAGQIKHGKGRMPAFTMLSDAEVAALIALLKTPPAADAPAAAPALAAASGASGIASGAPSLP